MFELIVFLPQHYLYTLLSSVESKMQMPPLQYKHYQHFCVDCISNSTCVFALCQMHTHCYLQQTVHGKLLPYVCVDCISNSTHVSLYCMLRAANSFAICRRLPDLTAIFCQIKNNTPFVMSSCKKRFCSLGKAFLRVSKV